MLLEFIIVMSIAASVFWFVIWPLRGPAPGADQGIDPRLLEDRDRAQLAKDRKLDEIRELRADRAAGKLADRDAAPLERALRSEAADLLHALDEAEAAIDAAEAALGQAEPLRWGLMEPVLQIIQLLLSIGLIAGVLAHAGKDGGLSGAFGVGSGQGSLGGGSMMERNVTRWTIALGILWVLNTIALIKLASG